MRTGEKVKTEAAQIIDRLQLAGMKRAEIAKHLGVSAETVRNISRGLSTGETYLDPLRGMRRFVAGASSPSLTQEPYQGAYPGSHQGSNTGTGTGDAPGTSAPGSDPTQAAMGAPEVEEAPKDERNDFQRAKDYLGDLFVRAQSRSGHGSKEGREAAEKAAYVVAGIPALVLAFSAQRMIPDPYKIVGPTVEEGRSIIMPLARLIVKQLESAGYISENTLAILESAYYAERYGERAYGDYRNIQRIVNEYPNGDARNVRQGTPTRPQGQAPQAQPQQQPMPQPMPTTQAPQPVVHYLPAAAAGVPVGGRQAQQQQPTQQQQGKGEQNGKTKVGEHDPFGSLYAADAAGRRSLGIN